MAAGEGEISPPPLKRRKTKQLSPSPEPPSPGEDNSNITIYSWNVNGISPLVQRPITSFFKRESSVGNHADASSSTGLRDVLRRYSWPTMLLLQEVKISPDDASTQRAVERAVLPCDGEPSSQPSYKAFFCLPSDRYNARGFGRKVYGVCSLIRQDFFDSSVERVREVDWDSEGRFLVCETKAMGAVGKLAIINIYAVNGTDAPYKDPETGGVAGTRHDRKLQVQKLLQAECRSLESRGMQVILAGDLNVARSTLDGHPNLRTAPKQHCINRADFEARFFQGSTESAEMDVAAHPDNADQGDSSLAMVDSFRHLHGQRPGYTYYPRGKAFGASCDRVDMILTSRSLKDRLAQAGIHETPADRGLSDHVPLYITLRLH